jgi:hypothetical protein
MTNFGKLLKDSAKTKQETGEYPVGQYLIDDDTEITIYKDGGHRIREKGGYNSGGKI